MIETRENYYKSDAASINILLDFIKLLTVKKLFGERDHHCDFVRFELYISGIHVAAGGIYQYVMLFPTIETFKIGNEWKIEKKTNGYCLKWSLVIVIGTVSTTLLH